MSKMIRKAVSVALFAALPMSAVLAADLYGGGATFPALPYVGTNFTLTSPRARLSTDLPNNPQPSPWVTTTIDSTSIFGAFSSANANLMSYCQTGSGTGKSILTGVTATAGECRDFSASQFQFYAPRVDYIGTDSPTTKAEYDNFNINRASATAIVQFPTLAGSIALPFQHSGAAGTLDLSVAQVCDIFSGVITNFSALGLPAKPIKVVYRTDSSGTSFSFTNFLAANCNIARGGTIPNRPDGSAYFQTNQVYSSAVPATLAGSIGVSGNSNVVAEVLKPVNDGAIGYADPGDVLAAVPSGSRWFTVNTFDPMTFALPALANADLLTGQVASNSGAPGDGLPTLQPAPTGAANLASILVVRPSLTVSTGYPIFAVTYIGATKTGNTATRAPALQCLGHYIYGHTVAGCSLTGRPVLTNGYSYINDTVPAVRLKVNTAINSIAP